MLATARAGRRPSRPFAIGFVALITAVLLGLAVGVTADAATTTKPYTATWLTASGPIANPPNSLGIPGGSATLTLRITNNANPQSLGSANITPPQGYTLTGGSVVGNTLQLRNLNLAPAASVDVTINVTTPCLAGGPSQAWTLVVKQANNFSGPPGNDFVRAAGTAAPSTFATVPPSCLLRFANQPNTTKTGAIIRDGFASSGNDIKVEIFDPITELTVNSNAAVTLDASFNPSLGTLTGGGPVNAVGGVATFPALSLDKAGAYKLHASSPAASDSPSSTSNQFMVADTIETCSGTGCSFTLPEGQNTYTTTPKKGVEGATYVASLNLPGLRISCDFSPFNYPDSRQPNSVWYVYDDENTDSAKTNKIVIDKATVQATAENGTSFYRVCYTSPVRFRDRTGVLAPADPGVWNTTVTGAIGPSQYFGTTWYTGLLPDCAKKNPDPADPCVVSWTGDSAGNRVGTFSTPPGDPGYR